MVSIRGPVFGSGVEGRVRTNPVDEDSESGLVAPNGGLGRVLGLLDFDVSFESFVPVECDGFAFVHGFAVCSMIMDF